MLWLAFHFASPIAVIYALEHVKHKDLGWAPAVWNLQAVFTDLMSTVISFADFPHDLPAPPNQPTAGMQLYQALATWGLILSFFTVVYLLILLFIQRFMDKKPINAINHGGDDEADELIVPPPSSVQRQIHRSVAVTKRLV
jgi:H+/Cl- antiporter ClcA